MKATNDVPRIEKMENDFYAIFLQKAISFAKSPKDSNMNNASFRQIVAAASVMAKQKQSRIANRALQYQINKESGKFPMRKTKLLAENSSTS